MNFNNYECDGQLSLFDVDDYNIISRTPPNMPKEYYGKLNAGNQYTNSIPREWTKDEIDWCLELKRKGYSNEQIANSIGRTPVSLSIKLKRLGKKNNSYNSKHLFEKYDLNDKFVKDLKPSSIIDAYCGVKKFYSSYDFVKKYYTNDKDVNIDADYHMDAFCFMCKLYCDGIRADFVDLDPFGSAYDCFDIAIKMARKGIAITLGEIGHKRFKRLDFVERYYWIENFEDFTTDNLINHIVKIGERNKKKLVPVYVREWRNISRVWFLIEPIKITEQWGE